MESILFPFEKYCNGFTELMYSMESDVCEMVLVYRFLRHHLNKYEFIGKG